LLFLYQTQNDANGKTSDYQKQADCSQVHIDFSLLMGYVFNSRAEKPGYLIA